MAPRNERIYKDPDLGSEIFTLAPLFDKATLHPGMRLITLLVQCALALSIVGTPLGESRNLVAKDIIRPG